MTTATVRWAGGVIAVLLALLVGLTVVAAADEEETGTPVGLVNGALDIKSIPPEYAEWVERAGKECKEVSAPLVAAQIAAESGWNPKAESPVGAQGLSQFMPGTWKTWGVDAAGKDGSAEPDGTADPFTPGDAIMTQARYDCWLAGKVKEMGLKDDPTRLLLAAYNAGPGAIEQFGGVPLYPETQSYVTKIIASMAEYSGGGAGGKIEKGGPFGDRVVAYAKKWLGTPYAWGGGGPEGPGRGFAQGANTVGFDCSSLVQYAVYRASDGKTMPPRTSQVQVTAGKPVSRDEMQPGDVIGFALHGSYDHIGIYLGNGQFIHAPKTGDVVKISQLDDSYYASKPQKVRRFG
ncbi:bifunctional lytic transglycosylase/C40 family peptidase [Streptomyces sp. NBC_01775]|uniref:bifunctional lytic transglycosylase/C40 family peptidase n=1 Tax=Streptomyces sp. NBC_01775 TaxID=2975939 RepID=UPI002DD87830|nr:bifunctional lytic transglycosylase/C40 family peptidase [Streptomyces sp. NBC_01775]WSB75717.1 bifunctional lytic transglycosylase/C40 family peptidase [Streptomyces sp. NBC_01775]